MADENPFSIQSGGLIWMNGGPTPYLPVSTPEPVSAPSPFPPDSKLPVPPFEYELKYGRRFQQPRLFQPKPVTFTTLSALAEGIVVGAAALVGLGTAVLAVGPGPAIAGIPSGEGLKEEKGVSLTPEEWSQVEAQIQKSPGDHALWIVAVRTGSRHEIDLILKHAKDGEILELPGLYPDLFADFPGVGSPFEQIADRGLTEEPRQAPSSVPPRETFELPSPHSAADPMEVSWMRDWAVSRRLRAGDRAIVRWYESEIGTIMEEARREGYVEIVKRAEALLNRVHKGERNLEKEWFGLFRDVAQERYSTEPSANEFPAAPSAPLEDQASKMREEGNRILDAIPYGAGLRAAALTEDPILILNQFLRGELGREPTQREVKILVQEMKGGTIGSSVIGHTVIGHNPRFSVPVIYQIFTKEFLDAYAGELLQRVTSFHTRYGRPPVIVEIGAGDGRFTQALNKRLQSHGIVVQATDIEGSTSGSQTVVSQDGVSAARGADIILANWMPPLENFDVEVTKEVLRHPEKTFILLVAEPIETNSHEFWTFIENGGVVVEHSTMQQPVYPHALSGDRLHRSDVLAIRSSLGH